MPRYPYNDNFKYMTMAELVDIWERAGYVYETSGEFDLAARGAGETPAAGSFNQVIFKAGSRPVVFFSREISYNRVGLNVDIYRDPVYSGGVNLEYYNANDVNPQPNYPEPTEGQEQGDQFLTSPTVTNIGVKSRATRPIFGNESIQGQGQPIQAINSPQILAPFDEICFYVESRDENNVQTFASLVRWASPPDISDYIFDENGAFEKYKGPIEQEGE